MLNNNYALQQAKKLGNSVERVRNDDIDLYIAKNNPKYIETSNDRPNFYAKFLYDKAKVDNPNLTKEEFVDSEISKYETNDLELVKINNKGIVAIYMVDNINLVMTIRPYAIAQQLGIDIKEIYSLNYIKVVLKDTNETKYMWIDSFVNNESRKESITLSCSTDVWLTNYKQIILNINGDIKIIRKHFDRFVERNGRLIGNYASDSNIHNVDGKYSNLTTGTIRSLGVRVQQDEQQVGEDIHILDNEIRFNFNIGNTHYRDYNINSINGDEKNFSNLKSVRPYGYGSGKPIVVSSFNKEGTNQNKAITYIGNTKKEDGVFNWSSGNINPTSYNNTSYDNNSYKCYGPKLLKLSQNRTQQYIYTIRFDTQDKDISQGESYGVLVSDRIMDNDTKWGKNIINRIDNVYNLNLNYGSESKPSMSVRDVNDGVSKWLWEVRTIDSGIYSYDRFSSTNSPSSAKTGSGLPAYYLVGLGYTLKDFVSSGKLGLFVVGYDKNNIEVRKIQMVGATINSFLPEPYFRLGPTPSVGGDSRSYASAYYGTLASVGGFVDSVSSSANIQIAQKPFISVSFKGSGTITQVGTFSGSNLKTTSFSVNLTFSNKDEGSPDISTKADPYTISEWNKGANNPCYFNNEIIQPEFSDLMEPLKLRFSPVVYEKDANWKYDREPQIKMGHCIKHFVDYLGVRKQLFLEFGNVDKIFMNQSILPNMCVDKIYYTDSEKDYNAWELINTNGFLTKQYDNSIPRVSDSWLQFISSNQAQLTNSYLTANTNLDFAKQQASLNTQQQQLNSNKGIFGDVMGMVGNVVGGLGQIAGGVASGNPFDLGSGIAKATTGLAGGIGDLIFGSQQRELDKKQTQLNNQKMIFSAEQQVNSLDAMVKDKFNQPDQLISGSVECNGIIRYQQELSILFERNGTTNGKVNFKIDTQTPTKTQLMEYSQFLHQNGYISNNLYLNQDIDTLLSRTRFNFIQLGDIQNMFKNVKANIMTKNYFMNMFNKGVRLWNVGYENQQMLDYSKENWEIMLEK